MDALSSGNPGVTDTHRVADPGDLVESWFREPAATLQLPAVPSPAPPDRAVGRVLAVWGPTGAPGRTTVAIALADEAARLGVATLLLDADPYGGTIAQILGIRAETAGVALACRDAAAGRLDPVRLAQRSRQLRPGLRVLTGIARADRWPELRPTALPVVLDQARRLCALTVVDCGFCLEQEEEPSTPQRNGATLAALAAADTVVCVGTADPVGVQRLIRGLDELREVLPGTVPLVVVNRLRAGGADGAARRDIEAALRSWGGIEATAYLPVDAEGLDAVMRAGATLAEVAPASSLRRALAELTRQLTGLPEPAPRRRRLFGRR